MVNTSFVDEYSMNLKLCSENSHFCKHHQTITSKTSKGPLLPSILPFLLYTDGIKEVVIIYFIPNVFLEIICSRTKNKLYPIHYSNRESHNFIS